MQRAGHSNSTKVFDFQPCGCGNTVGTAVKNVTCLPDVKYSNHAPEPLPNKRLVEVLWTCPGPWGMTGLSEKYILSQEIMTGSAVCFPCLKEMVQL